MLLGKLTLCFLQLGQKSPPTLGLRKVGGNYFYRISINSPIYFHRTPSVFLWCNQLGDKMSIHHGTTPSWWTFSSRIGTFFPTYFDCTLSPSSFFGDGELFVCRKVPHTWSLHKALPTKNYFVLDISENVLPQSP